MSLAICDSRAQFETGYRNKYFLTHWTSTKLVDQFDATLSLGVTIAAQDPKKPNQEESSSWKTNKTECGLCVSGSADSFILLVATEATPPPCQTFCWDNSQKKQQKEKTTKNKNKKHVTKQGNQSLVGFFFPSNCRVLSAQSFITSSSSAPLLDFLHRLHCCVSLSASPFRTTLSIYLPSMPLSVSFP